jgi:archaellum biogenesis protein FlaJ (TadC family)
MIFSKKYALLAYNLFGNNTEKVARYFRDAAVKAKRADMRITVEEYAASFLLTEIILAPLSFLTTLVYFSFLAEMGIIPAFLTSVMISIGLAFVVYSFYSVYPSYKLNELRSSIDRDLAYAATHMSTIAGTGAPPYVMFRLIGEFKEYRDVAKECRKISRNIEVFGYDTVSAVSEAAQRTPSSKLKDLLWSIVSTIRTGGDLRGLLAGKARALMEEHRRVEARYIDLLSVMAEMYATLFIAGVILTFVLLTTMGLIGGLPISIKLILQVTTYFLVPVGATVFMVMIETSKPAGV